MVITLRQTKEVEEIHHHFTAHLLINFATSWIGYKCFRTGKTCCRFPRRCTKFAISLGPFSKSEKYRVGVGEIYSSSPLASTSIDHLWLTIRVILKSFLRPFPRIHLAALQGTETPSQYYRRRLHHPKPEEPHIRIQVCSSKNCTSLIIVFFFRTSEARLPLLGDTRACMRLWIFALGKYFNRTSYLCLSLWPPGSWQRWREWSILCPDWTTQQPIRNIFAPLHTHT